MKTASQWVRIVADAGDHASLEAAFAECQRDAIEAAASVVEWCRWPTPGSVDVPTMVANGALEAAAKGVRALLPPATATDDGKGGQ